jgi:hypothetical protein
LVTEGRIVDIVEAGFDLGLRSADLVPSDMIAIPIGPPRRFVPELRVRPLGGLKHVHLTDLGYIRSDDLTLKNVVTYYTKGKAMTINSIEHVTIANKPHVIYWLEPEGGSTRPGIIFEGDYVNIARQSIVESLLLGNSLLGDMVETLEKQEGDANARP